MSESQSNLWGINIYPGARGDDFIEFDSMINIRPMLQNPSRDVLDGTRRIAIREIVMQLVAE